MGSSYTDKGINFYNSEGVLISHDTRILDGVTQVGSLDTSIKKTYIIEYTAGLSPNVVKVIRTVNVIDKDVPDNPVITPNITSPTNNDVSVSIVYSPDSLVREYKIGAGSWASYVSPVIVTGNNTIYARARNAEGYYSNEVVRNAEGYYSNEVVLIVNNIDKTPPTTPTLVQNPTAVTNGNVTLTITYSGDSTVREYKIGAGAWTAYTAAVTITDNATVYARGRDAVGNYSTEGIINITNIDRIVPATPTLVQNPTAVTNGNVTLTITYSGDSTVREYKIGAGAWTAYTAALTITDNATVYARGRDAAGNNSLEGSINITNIDKTAPTNPTFSQNPTLPTIGSVTLTITYSGDSTVREYRIGAGAWTTYVGPLTITNNNTTVSARASDAVGNYSGTPSTIINNIQVEWAFDVEVTAGSLNFGFAAVNPNMTVYWGDGTNTNYTATGYPTKTYATAGIKRITLRGTANKISFCTINTWEGCDAQATPAKLRDVVTVIPTAFGLTDGSYMFANTTVTSFSVPNFFDAAARNIWNMTGMFNGATNFNHNITNWDMTSAYYTNEMFKGASNFNQPIGSWNMANVNYPYHMFYNATSFNQPLNSWNTLNFRSIDGMFYGATAFNQNINSWNTSNVTNFAYLFFNASSYNQPLNNWNTANGQRMDWMFYNADAFNQNISSWNVSSATTFSGMFFDNNAFNNGGQPMNTWVTSALTNTSNMFYSAKAFNQNVGTWNMSNVTTIHGMFHAATLFNNGGQPISNWNTSNITNMGYAFGATSFNQPIPRSGNLWNTSKVTAMEYMFYGGNFNQNLSNWCVPLIASEPPVFTSASHSLPRPSWGTCP